MFHSGVPALKKKFDAKYKTKNKDLISKIKTLDEKYYWESEWRVSDVIKTYK